MSNRAKFRVSFVLDIDLDDITPNHGETKEETAIDMIKCAVPSSATADDDIITDITCIKVD